MLPATSSEVNVTVAVTLLVRSTQTPAYGPGKPEIAALGVPMSKQKGAALAPPAQLVSAAAAAAAKSLSLRPHRKNPRCFMIVLRRRLHGAIPPVSGRRHYAGSIANAPRANALLLNSGALSRARVAAA